MVKLNHHPYNPLTKMKSVKADVLNALGHEEAIAYIMKYHRNKETGPKEYETPEGKVRVYSDDIYIYLAWA